MHWRNSLKRWNWETSYNLHIFGKQTKKKKRSNSFQILLELNNNVRHERGKKGEVSYLQSERGQRMEMEGGREQEIKKQPPYMTTVMGPVSTSPQHVSQWLLCQAGAVRQKSSSLKRWTCGFFGVFFFGGVFFWGRGFCQTVVSSDWQDRPAAGWSAARSWKNFGTGEVFLRSCRRRGCLLRKAFTGSSRLLASWRVCPWSLAAPLRRWWTPVVDARPAPRWPPRCRIWDENRSGVIAFK